MLTKERIQGLTKREEIIAEIEKMYKEYLEEAELDEYEYPPEEFRERLLDEDDEWDDDLLYEWLIQR